jgi:hypothetical protein
VRDLWKEWKVRIAGPPVEQLIARAGCQRTSRGAREFTAEVVKEVLAREYTR